MFPLLFVCFLSKHGEFPVFFVRPGHAKTEKSGAPRTERSEYDDFEAETPTSHSASDFEASPTNNAGNMT